MVDSINFTSGYLGNSDFNWEIIDRTWDFEYIFDDSSLLDNPNIRITTIHAASMELPVNYAKFEKELDLDNYLNFSINLNDKYRNNMNSITQANSAISVVFGNNLLNEVEFSNASGNVLTYYINFEDLFYNSKFNFEKISGDYKAGTYTLNYGEYPDLSNADEVNLNTFLFHHKYNSSYLFDFQGRGIFVLNLPSIIKINYVDTFGSTLSESEILKDELGEAYSTTPKSISGYKFLRNEGDMSGQFGEDPKEITFIYERSAGGNEVNVPQPPDEKLPKTSMNDNSSLVWFLISSFIFSINRLIRMMNQK